MDLETWEDIVLSLKVARLGRENGDEDKLIDLDGCGRGERMLS